MRDRDGSSRGPQQRRARRHLARVRRRAARLSLGRALDTNTGHPIGDSRASRGRRIVRLLRSRSSAARKMLEQN